MNIDVPQGSCFDPLIFLAYINDLSFLLLKSKATMYADDTIVSDSNENAYELNKIANAELTCLEK